MKQCVLWNSTEAVDLWGEAETGLDEEFTGCNNINSPIPSFDDETCICIKQCI